MIVNPEVVEAYTRYKKQNTPKSAKKLLKSKRIINIKMSAKRGPVSTFSLPREAARPCQTLVTSRFFMLDVAHSQADVETEFDSDITDSDIFINISFDKMIF